MTDITEEVSDINIERDAWTYFEYEGRNKLLEQVADSGRESIGASLEMKIQKFSPCFLGFLAILSAVYLS